MLKLGATSELQLSDRLTLAEEAVDHDAGGGPGRIRQLVVDDQRLANLQVHKDTCIAGRDDYQHLRHMITRPV